MTERPLFLISNDDGIDSPGIAALEEAAADFGEVLTVAQRWEMSATSHAITLHTPLRLLPAGPNRFAVHEGTPADCVYLALNHLVSRPPTAVLSGINLGFNLGHDVIYSGTVAAARQAYLQGHLGIAFSTTKGEGWDFAEVVPWVKRVLQACLEPSRRRARLLNVNIPSQSVAPVREIRATVLGHRLFSPDMEKRVDPRGREYLWIAGTSIQTLDIPGSDVNAIRDSCVSITPLGTDTTDLAGVEELRGWTGFTREPTAEAGVDAGQQTRTERA
jgi:5'-nucleotidase